MKTTVDPSSRLVSLNFSNFINSETVVAIHTKASPWARRFLGETNWNDKRGSLKNTTRLSSKPTLSAFRSLVADVKTVLNDRPFNPSNVVSDGESLSPAHIMYGRRLNTLHYNEVINMTRNSIQHMVNVPTS